MRVYRPSTKITAPLENAGQNTKETRENVTNFETCNVTEAGMMLKICFWQDIHPGISNKIVLLDFMNLCSCQN